MAASTPITHGSPPRPAPQPRADAPGPARSVWQAILLAVAGSLVIAVSAKLQIPFWPVPLTVQSLAVMVLGAALGPGVSVAAVLLYVVEGACGLPVFAGTGRGLAVLTGPTGGFLLGFVLAAPCVGWLVRRGWGRSLGGAALAMVVGHAVLFVPGLVWLSHRMGEAPAVRFGLTPFLAAILLKVAAGAVLIRALPRRAD